MEKNKSISRKRKIILAYVGLIGVLVLGFILTKAWFTNKKSIETVTQIHTPTVLVIGSGNKEDIQQLNLGDIDVTDGTYKDFVFCVYSDLSKDYILQLAHTTNIKFEYTIYKAEEISEADATGHLYETSSFLTSANDIDTRNFVNIVPYIGMSGNYFYRRGERLTGDFLNRNTSSDFLANREEISYEDYAGFQKNANPLYWQSDIVDFKQDSIIGENLGFCDYYILTLSWNPGEVKNDKETDIVYLTASLN